MAFNVSYIFQARDQFSAVARKIKQQTKGLRKQFKGLRSQLSRTNTAFKKTSSTMSSGFRRMAVAAIGFFGAREFIRTGAQFQTSMADLSAITGATGQKLESFQANILKMAKASGTSQEQVALAVTSIASLKSELLDTEGAVEKVTEQALLLANASGIEIPAAVRASVGALNQFNQGADQASRFVNVIAAGAKIGASLVGETAEALKNAGAVASQFNVSFEETNALIQVLAKNEIKGAEAGTKLRGVLSKLEKIADGKIAPSIIGITASLDALAAANLSNTQIIKEFGEESLAAILILRKNIPLVKEYTSKLTGTKVASEQAAIRLSTFNSKMKVLGIVIKDKLIAVFNKLEPIFKKITEDVTRFIDSITPQQVETFANGLKKFTLASVEVVKQLSTQLIPLVKEFIGTMDTKSVSSMVDNLTSIASAVNLILAPVKLLAALFKGVGTAIGEGAAQLATFNFDAKNATSFLDAFTLGGKFLGLIEREQAAPPKIPSAPSVSPTGSNSQADVNININAPEGVVDSVKTQKKGPSEGMNLGVNMVGAT